MGGFVLLGVRHGPRGVMDDCYRASGRRNGAIGN